MCGGRCGRVERRAQEYSTQNMKLLCGGWNSEHFISCKACKAWIILMLHCCLLARHVAVIQESHPKKAPFHNPSLGQ